MLAYTCSLVAFRSGFLHFLSFSSVSAASKGERPGSLANKFSAASNVWNKIFIGIFLKFNARLRQKRGEAFFGLDKNLVASGNFKQIQNA